VRVHAVEQQHVLAQRGSDFHHSHRFRHGSVLHRPVPGLTR
jgi:hypothetical protein